MSTTLAEFSTVCARCDGPMVAKPDAIGRIRVRCPRCDGVSAPQVRHPDDAMIPQGLVHLIGTLPPVAPGQLRCQRCARGIAGSGRFCAECQTRGRPRMHPLRPKGTISARCYAAKTCLRCGNSFQPSGPRALYCGGCK